MRAATALFVHQVKIKKKRILPEARLPADIQNRQIRKLGRLNSLKRTLELSS